MAVIKFTTSNPRIDGQLTWTAASNGPAANSSRVTIAIHLRRNNVGYVSYGTFNTHVTCNGARQDENGLYVTITENDWTLVYAKIFTVPHNSDGTKTCGIDINGDSDFSLSFGAHFDVVLPKIPRYTSITAWSASGVTDNSITFSWAAADNISNIVCQFNGVTKYSSGSLNTSSGSFTVTSLSEHTTYSNIKIIVTRKDSGLTTTSGALSVTTGYIAPTANLAFQSNTINSIVLNWSSNFACDAVWIYNSGSQIYTAAGLNTASGSVTLSPSTWAAIAPGTSYSLSVKVRRKVSGAVAASSAISVRTLSLPSISSGTPTAFNIGSSITAQLVNYANNASSLAFQVYSGDWVTTDTVTAEKGVATKVITPNASVLYAKCPDSNTLSCRIACSVTCNGKTYPSYYYLTANVTSSNPSFSGFTFQTNVDTNINSVIGGTTNMLTRAGNLKLQFAANCAAGLNSATVTSLEIKIIHDNAVLANKTIPYTAAAFSHLYTDAFSAPGTYSLQINALDSRGNRSNIISKSFSVYSYNKPALEITMNRQNEFEEKTYLNLKGEISKVTILNTQKNSIEALKYRYAKSGDAYSDYIPLTGYTTASGSADNFIYTLNKQTDTNYFLKLDYEQSYTFQFLLTDKMFDSTVYEIFVPQGKPAFATFDNGYSIVDKIPKFNSPAKLQVGSDIMVQDSTGQDVLLLEQINDAAGDIDLLKSLDYSGDKSVLSDALFIDISDYKNTLNLSKQRLYTNGGTSSMPAGCTLGIREFYYFNPNWFIIKITELSPKLGRTWYNRYDKVAQVWHGWEQGKAVDDTFPQTLQWQGQFGNTNLGFSFPANIICTKYANGTCDVHIHCKCESNTSTSHTAEIFNYSALLSACHANRISFTPNQTEVIQTITSDMPNNKIYASYLGRTGLHFEQSGQLESLHFTRAYNDEMSMGGWGNEASELYAVGNYFHIDIWGASYA